MLNMFCIIVFTRDEKDRTVKKAREEHVFEKKMKSSRNIIAFLSVIARTKQKKQNMGFFKLAKHSHFPEDGKKEAN